MPRWAKGSGAKAQAHTCCEKNKSQNHNSVVIGSGSRRRLRQDIHDRLNSASLAFHRQVADLRSRQQEKHRGFAACRAQVASFVCYHFSTLVLVFQGLASPFLGTPRLLYTTPRPIFRYSVRGFRENGHHVTESSVAIIALGFVCDPGSGRR